MNTRRREPGWASEPARLVATWVAVVAGGACGLRLVDAIPRLVLGESRGIETCADLADAEARVGAPIALPKFFPETLVWPPQTILFAYGPPKATTVTFLDRATGAPRLTLYQSLSNDGTFPDTIRPPVDVFHEVAVDLDGDAGRLLRVRAPRGEIWDEIHWRRDGMSFAIRYRGPGEETLRIARSVEGRP